MKEATIKAIQELCDALMKEMNLSCDSNRTKILIAADRLKRVLDEEPKGHCDECAPEFGCWNNPEECRKKQ